MFNHYKKQANDCWDLYADISSAAYMFGYYMQMADMYENILKQII